MAGRYTEKVVRILNFARQEAIDAGSNLIEVEHLLLGLLRELNDPLQHIFRRFRIEAREVYTEIQRRIAQVSPFYINEPRLSSRAERVLDYALKEAETLGHKYLNPEHILLGILRVEDSYASRYLRMRGMTPARVRQELMRGTKDRAITIKSVKFPKDSPMLNEFCRDLTSYAENRLLDPLIGRERELERIIQILSRRTKNNPVLVGEPGVGKTAIVEGLAQRVVNRDVPKAIQERRILSLDLAAIVAGTKYRGQFEERMRALIQELLENPEVILFIDEIHTLVGAGSAEGSLDAANILKPALSRREIQCIGATTPAEYRKYFERDRALERRFQPVFIHPSSEEETYEILQGVKEQYENYHHVHYTDEALRSIVYLSSRYITERVLPDKAIDLLDECGAFVRILAEREQDKVIPFEAEEKADDRVIPLDPEKSVIDLDQPDTDAYLDEFTQELESADESEAVEEEVRYIVTEDIVAQVVSRWTNIPIQTLQENERERLQRLDRELKRWIVSQRHAIDTLVRAIRRSRMGLKEPHKPVGSFMFLGPTGVGKTEVARQLSRVLFGSEQALLRFDMSEYMEPHSVSKLIGAPPGYVGYEEGGMLTERVRRNPYCVILLDEIEKAHPQVFNILLQILDDGRLSDALGHTVDFRHTIIIMTSNLGTRIIQQKPQMGFQAAQDEMGNYRVIRDRVLQEVKHHFSPEFINRIDDFIVFYPLTDEDLSKILDLMVDRMNRELAERSAGYYLELTPEVRQFLLDVTRNERHYGARPLKRALQTYVEDPLVDFLLNHDQERIQGCIRVRRGREGGMACEPVVLEPEHSMV